MAMTLQEKQAVEWESATQAAQQSKTGGPRNTRRGFVRCEETAHLDHEALSLRSSGLTYEEMAKRLGCNRSTALRRCQRALGEIPRETAEEYRALEAIRLDDLYAVAFEKVEQGSLTAIDRCLSIMARRARLFGLDAPTRSRAEAVPEIIHPSKDQIEREIQRIRQIIAKHSDRNDNE